MAPPRTEDKERTRKRIAAQGLTTEGGQAVNAFAEVHRLDRHQDAHLRSDLDHARLQKLWAKAKSVLRSLRTRKVIRAPVPSDSSTAAWSVTASDTHGLFTSTKAGVALWSETVPASRSRSL
jgi:hypothetical protein